MKRITALAVIFALVVILSGCGHKISREDAQSVVDPFFAALKEYDREAMSGYLTEFPDNTGYVYVDDIFNDEAYVKLYRQLYSSITYSIKSTNGTHVVLEVSMPNIHALYTDISARIMSLTLMDETLRDKLEENSENAVVLLQETMLSIASKDPEQIEKMTQEYTLTLQKKNGTYQIATDDEVRKLLTGNLFLAKSTTVESMNSTAAE
ncbi:MAG: hypothetical protein IJN34_03790 [Clostridia bacterium]|nr:hypothetical protein [Clostridia bacterium]